MITVSMMAATGRIASHSVMRSALSRKIEARIVK
jgi:hypothetical protein